MNTTLIQLISVVQYGNQVIKGAQLPILFSTNNPAFRPFRTIDFYKVDLDDMDVRPRLIAENPADWFDYLIQHNCQALRLMAYPIDEDFLSISFGEDDKHWMIETIFNDYSIFWMMQSNLEENNRGQKTGEIHYIMGPQADTIDMGDDLLFAKKRLTAALKNILKFACNHPNSFDGDRWARIFNTSLEVLDNYHLRNLFEEKRYDASWLPMNAISDTALQLIFASYKAFVFGGEGSWTDQSFDSEEAQEEFIKTSAQLYQALQDAILSAVNREE